MALNDRLTLDDGTRWLSRLAVQIVVQIVVQIGDNYKGPLKPCPVKQQWQLDKWDAMDSPQPISR